MDDPQDWGMKKHALAPEHPDWIAEVQSPETLREAPKLGLPLWLILSEPRGRPGPGKEKAQAKPKSLARLTGNDCPAVSNMDSVKLNSP